MKNDVGTKNAQNVDLSLQVPKESFFKYFKNNYWLYIFILPGMLFLFIFKYIPMGGILMAFQDFKATRGIWGSEWVGFEQFEYLFQSTAFWNVLSNSIIISMLRLIFSFPVPVILALMLNEMKKIKYKRVMQTILYLPHFISWVVVVGMINNILSPSTGVVNHLIELAGGESIPFLSSPDYFRTVLVSSEIWKGAGWGTIVYLAAMAGIDPTFYEAATIDGATRFQRIRYITLPCVASTIIVMLILRMGSILNNGFEQVYLLQNGLNISVSEVFETYTYKVGIREGRFSYATAVGLFQSAVGCIMIFTTNIFAKKVGERGLW